MGGRHTRCLSDWSSDVCSSDLGKAGAPPACLRNIRFWNRLRQIDLGRALRLNGEPVANLADRDDVQRVGGIGLQFPAQLGDVCVHGRSEERRVGKECTYGGTAYEMPK